MTYSKCPNTGETCRTLTETINEAKQKYKDTYSDNFEIDTAKTCAVGLMDLVVEAEYAECGLNAYYDVSRDSNVALEETVGERVLDQIEFDTNMQSSLAGFDIPIHPWEVK